MARTIKILRFMFWLHPSRARAKALSPFFVKKGKKDGGVRVTPPSKKRIFERPFFFLAEFVPRIYFLKKPCLKKEKNLLRKKKEKGPEKNSVRVTPFSFWLPRFLVCWGRVVLFFMRSIKRFFEIPFKKRISVRKTGTLYVSYQKEMKKKIIFHQKVFVFFYSSLFFFVLRKRIKLGNNFSLRTAKE